MNKHIAKIIQNNTANQAQQLFFMCLDVCLILLFMSDFKLLFVCFFVCFKCTKKRD